MDANNINLELNKNFSKDHKTCSRIWSKSDFQEMLKAVRKQGFIVSKIDSGYTMHANNGVLLLRAMNGRNGYLVRQVCDLFG